MRVCTPQETQDPNTGQSFFEDYQICFRSIGETGSSAYRVRKINLVCILCVMQSVVIKIIVHSQGDSGGPVSMKSKDQHILVGDTSFGASCILAGSMVKSTNSFLYGGTVCIKCMFQNPQFSIFGRVSYFRAWLEEQMPDVKTCRQVTHNSRSLVLQLVNCTFV